jgi:hypothetical protein
MHIPFLTVLGGFGIDSTRSLRKAKELLTSIANFRASVHLSLRRADATWEVRRSSQWLTEMYFVCPWGLWIESRLRCSGSNHFTSECFDGPVSQLPSQHAGGASADSSFGRLIGVARLISNCDGTECDEIVVVVVYLHQSAIFGTVLLSFI